MWRVAVHNDHVTSFEVVVHYLQTLCRFSFDDALRLAFDIEQLGSVDVAELPGQGEAEQLVVAFQRHGIHAMIRSV